MSRYEQPEYRVVASGDGYELRDYESHLVAETTVEGDFDNTGNVAFGRLAGFIFGRNSESEKMNMTVMERAYTEETLPRPVDGTITVVRVPGGHYAAARYRGGRGEARFRRAATELFAALARDGVEVTGEPEAAVYDGPFVPAPIRRNEVLIPVAAPR